jgi:hypothetical protein
MRWARVVGGWKSAARSTFLEMHPATYGIRAGCLDDSVFPEVCTRSLQGFGHERPDVRSELIAVVPAAGLWRPVPHRVTRPRQEGGRVWPDSGRISIHRRHGGGNSLVFQCFAPRIEIGDPRQERVSYGAFLFLAGFGRILAGFVSTAAQLPVYRGPPVPPRSTTPAATSSATGSQCDEGGSRPRRRASETAK